MADSIKPLRDIVLAEPNQAQSVTAAGIHLPKDADQKYKTATVLEVGSDVKDIKVGDCIVCPEEYSYTHFKHLDKDYVLVEAKKILAVIK